MGTKPSPDKAEGKVAELLAVLPASKKILVLPHDNPDSDSLASAAALRSLISHKLKKSPIIGLSGTIGRSENRALVRVYRPIREPGVGESSRYSPGSAGTDFS